MMSDAPRNVLIVEDDGDFAESLADMLIPRGFRPTIAGTSEAAVKIMAGASGETPPPVALIDLRLGTTSGIDLLARLRHERPD